MEESKKPKTTQEDLQKDFQSNWQDLVLRYEEAIRRRDYKFWEDSWNDFSEE